jgi:hypothetical protein
MAGLTENEEHNQVQAHNEQNHQDEQQRNIIKQLLHPDTPVSTIHLTKL